MSGPSHVAWANPDITRNRPPAVQTVIRFCDKLAGRTKTANSAPAEGAAPGSDVGRKQKGAPPKRGPSGWPADLGRQFLLEPEPDDGDGDVLWFALGWLAVDELPLCEGD